MSSSSIAEAPVPSASPSETTLSSPAPVADDTSSQPTAPTSPPPSLPQPSLPPPPTPTAPPQVVASPPTASEPPLTSPLLPPPVTPTQPVISPPSPIIKTPSPSPPPPPPRPSATGPLQKPPPSPPPSATPAHPIVSTPLPPQPPKAKPRPLPPSLTLPSPSSPTETSPISPLPPETSFPPPPATPLRPTLSTRPTSASPLLPITPPVPPLPKSTLAPLSSSPSGLSLPSALASPPPTLASPLGPKFLTYGPAPLPPVNRNLTAKPGTGRLHISAGLALGGVVGVILLVIIVLGLFLFRCRYRRKEKDGPLEDHYKLQCLAKEDNCCAVAPKLPEKNVLPPWQQKLKASSNPCSPLPRVSSRESSGSISLGSGNPIPPQAPGAVLSHSRGTFTYNQLVSATNGFSESNLLGEGGFGYVHKGILPSRQEIAVKQLKKDGGQGEREFQAEIETISRVHHKHLVSLVGYCVTGPERLLVYEFLPNKTLEFHLHGEEQPVIEWAARMRIAIGSAKGIAYLHEDCKPAIVHRDIKASNILLDFRFEAKVSDFGLAKIFSDTNITHISTRVVGTFGYLAPEYASSGKVTEKSDVYSYGVMLLELITGCPPISKTDSRNEGLVGWARPLISQALEDGNFDGLVDPRLLGNYNTSEMTRMVACAAACVRHSAWLRPRLSQIVHALEGHVSLTDLDEGMPHGHSGLYGCSGSSKFDAQKCMEDMKKFNIALESEGYGISKCSESTSEYGLNPSCSSSEFRHNQGSR